MEKQRRSIAIAFVVIVVVAAIISFVGIMALSNEPVVLQGEIEAKQIRISGKLPGRIDTFLIAEGDYVRKGDTLVVINSPEVLAKYMQVNAFENIAKYQDKKVDSGTRTEIIKSVEQMWNKSKSDLALARITYQRIKNLYKDGVVTSQRMDETEAMYNAAVAAERASYQQYVLAKDGAQIEDKQSAKSLVNAAKGGTDEVQAVLDDARLVAPYNGQIASIYPEIGELVGVGEPIMNLVVLEDCHAVLNVREDYMPHFKMGGIFTADVPAIDKTDVEFKVYYISPLGSFATWRSTKQTGSYDMKTFQIKARPINKVNDLRPGMSLLVELDDVKK